MDEITPRSWVRRYRPLLVTVGVFAAIAAALYPAVMRTRNVAARMTDL